MSWVVIPSFLAFIPVSGSYSQPDAADFTSSFKDNGDWTMVGLNTGLLWQRTPGFVTRSSEGLS